MLPGTLSLHSNFSGSRGRGVSCTQVRQFDKGSRVRGHLDELAHHCLLCFLGELLGQHLNYFLKLGLKVLNAKLVFVALRLLVLS